MTDWKLIMETYNVLPEADRTTRKVHEKILKDERSLCFGGVRDVLSATVVSERVSKDDVRVTARTLTTLLDISLSSIRSGMSERGEPEATDLTFAQGSQARSGTLAARVPQTWRRHWRMCYVIIVHAWHLISSLPSSSKCMSLRGDRKRILKARILCSEVVN